MLGIPDNCRWNISVSVEKGSRLDVNKCKCADAYGMSLSSVHFYMVFRRSRKTMCAPLRLQEFPPCCLGNSSNVSLPDDDPFLSLRGGWSSASFFFFCTALCRHVIDRWCDVIGFGPQVVSQASQHFVSPRRQPFVMISLPASQSARSFPLTPACPE